ncbi:MAG: DNA primase [Elusimicrobia bacterium GWA2_56_46]|nr:MAG: DNA primase [Elusimicrobia bacterium GWA2_56_46]OGR55062.1 MAG: DNA primase [Elusimicrobia bacterium GWC2_56_31]HBB67526.1 DNA primase [Elusimicrobiota bacterium]HBW23781.1 DNA primase [Elusimicrobiota bacterium]
MTSHGISDSIREKLDIVEVVRDYIPALRRAGRNYKAVCPFHNEKTPSFTVSQDKQIFYCFGCNEGGDMFTFVMKIEGLTFVESLKKLSAKAGIQWQETEYHQLSAKEKERLDLKKVLSAAAEFYKKLLFSSNGERARLYLGGRKINKATVERFGLGFAPGEPSLTEELERKGFSKELIVTAGLAAVRESGQVSDYFRNRVMFPIRNAAGDVIAFGGRALEDGQQPKYLNSPETPLFSKRRTLYGLSEALPQVRKEGRMLILEGYMDVIAAHQHGVTFAVAPLGTALSADHAAFIKRYSRDTILMFDADEAGINASVRASDIFMDAGMYVKVADLGETLDPDEYLNEYGREAFDAKLAQAADPLEFRISALLRSRPGALASQDKAKLIEALLDTVVKQTDEILKSEWVKTLAARFDVTQESVLRQLKKKSVYAGGRRDDGGREAAPAGFPEAPAIELGFIHLLLKDPGLISQAKELTETDFQSPVSKKIFSAVKDMAGEDPSKAISRLTQLFPEYAGLIMKLSVEEMGPDMNTPRNAALAAGTIRKLSLERKRKELKSRFGSLTPAELAEYMALTGLLKTAAKTDPE